MAPADVAASQRGRLLRAIAEVTAAKGYAHVTVADIVGAARVSRQTFYEQFASKEDCYLAAYDTCTEALFTALSATGGVSVMLGTYLDLLAAEPAITKACLLDIYAAGPAAAARRERSQRRFAQLIKTVHRSLPGARPADDFTYEALVGAISSVVTTRVATGQLASLPALAPELERFLQTVLA
jgi:AcrR family transcriptional regulator